MGIYINHSPKMNRFELGALDRHTDGRTNVSQRCVMSPVSRDIVVLTLILITPTITVTRVTLLLLLYYLIVHKVQQNKSKCKLQLIHMHDAQHKSPTLKMLSQ